ncbi:hypothetical protein ACOBQJ_13220 [Pelotomaculum propionicicum]|uniref:hypothetical protein n=1 Tax=Pelotomaculum propionicicum TaxID=258475 RepID=UPI003B76B1C6
MTGENKNAITIVANQEMAVASNVQGLLLQIRPEWQSRKLIQRVIRLLPVDPSSACQRLFNAAIHDIKKKILVAGIDIAKEAATSNRLPQVNRPEDIDDYNVSKTIDLAYYMGLLSRPEWRRITRVYDIRKDLEHEDDEYEATIEDCFYIFKTSIEAVLAKDPIELIRLTDIKEIVEQPTAVALDHTVKEEYGVAPAVRQSEIYKFLISTALNDKHPDIVRQNCYISLGILSPITKDQVKIEVSQFYSDKIKRKGLDVFTARVSFTAGILPYFKKSILKTFYSSYLEQMKTIGYDFRSNDKHGRLLRELREIGGLEYCHEDILPGMIEWLCQCYIGERSFGRYSDSRKVFYSNIGAALAEEILLESKDRVAPLIEGIITKSKEIQSDCKWKYCQRRAQDLIDATTTV